MIVRSFVSAVVCASAVAVPASAATITFEGQTNTIYSSPITRLSFDIGNPIGEEQHFHEVDSTLFGLPSNGTGVLLNDRDTEIFVAETGGSDFYFVGVDVASALNNFPAVGLEIRGYLDNVQQWVFIFPALGTGYSSPLVLFPLGPIDLLVFDGTGGAGGFVIDNLTLEATAAVPEPASLLLLGTGLGAVAARRRLKKRA